MELAESAGDIDSAHNSGVTRTGLGSGGGSSRSTERGTIGKPVMLPHSGLVVRNTGPTMARQTGLKRSIRSGVAHGVSGWVV